ncbi:MAG: hypothetical protein HC845_11695 [Akkermansiaceae bacterium]|nr:hypothetical protein [Akkermansiaceae bacterium]
MNKKLNLPILGLLLFAGTAIGQDKVANPQRIDPFLIDQAPYRFNGLVLNFEASDEEGTTTTPAAPVLTSRGSGFCVWNRKTFFTAAHVVYDAPETSGGIAPTERGIWLPPPTWAPAVNAANLTGARQIKSRGYFRWRAFGDFASEIAINSPEAFGQDAVLCYALTPLIDGAPAKINLNGFNDLQTKKKSLITGYPAENFYREKPIDGFFLHETGPR